jgi:gliding motility-associated-like protein
MKKITLLLLLLLVSVGGYSQLYNQTEGFEGVTSSPTGPLPATWTLGTGDWAIFENNTPSSIGTAESWGINAFAATPVPYQGVNCASVNREQLVNAGNTSEDYLATSVISVPATGTIELHFWTRMFISGNQGTTFKVMIAPVFPGSQTDPTAYSDLQQWTEADLITPTTNFNQWTEKVVDISAYHSFDVYIAFVRVYTQPTTALDGDRWAIDNVGVNAQCTAPVAVTPTVMTSTTAQLSWSNPSGATSWEIEVVPAAGTPTGTPSYPVYNGALPFLATGLTPNTAYKFYVRAICPTGFTSPWSAASGNFTTQIAPPVCGGNLVDSGGTTGNYGNNENVSTTVCPVTPGDLVTVTFTAFNTQAGTDLLKIYDGSDITAPLLATLSGTTLPPSYTSSAASGCLTFVFTSNGTTTAAGYAANITCAPAPACRIPTALTATTPTTTSVTLNWTQPANPDTSVASTWDIIALPCGSPAPTASSVPTANDVTAGPGPSYVLTGLTPATCYDIYIRAVCATNSGWNSVPASISTLVAPPVCGGNFVDTGGTTGNYGNNANLTTVICPVTTGDAVTITFTAFNLENGADILKVYDGDNTSATLLASLTGTTLPPSFTSSAASGCLTFVFTSNATVNAAGWLANVTCAPLATCAAPTVLTNSTPTHNSVTLNWTQPANPDTTISTSWNVYAVACGSPAPTATSVPTATVNVAPPYVLTGLTPLTCYDIYVRSACGSTWTGPTTMTTLAAPPECGGNFVDAGGTTGPYAASSNITTVICPTTPGDLVTVTFTSFSTETNFDALYVYNGNAVVAANQIASANPAGNVPGGVAGGYWGTAIPGPFTSSDANGCLTFVFRSDTSVQNPGWLANVTCAPPPTCRKPTGIVTSVITSNSVTLNWTQPANPDSSVATAWQVLALPCGSPAPTASSTGFVDANTNVNFILTTLTSATCYDIYIRAVCSSTDSSTWAGPSTITTLVAPPECGGNFVDNGGPTANYTASANVTTTICPTTPGDVVTVTFTSFNTEANFDALYVYDGNAVVAANQIASTNPAANVPGGVAGGYWGTTIPGPFTSSSADGCLTFVFRSDTSVQNPGYIANITCAPPPTCRRPTAIVTSLITHNSVTLNWTQPANPDSSVATAWQVLALPCGSPAPGANPTTGILVNATTNVNFLLTGLTPSTCYDIYIRAVCSTTDSSAWGGPATITTLVAPPVCGGQFVDNGGAAANYAASSNVTTIICPTNPGEIVTVTFTSFNTEVNFDALYVYDGNAVIPSNQISSGNPAANVPGGLPGGFWGANIPGPFTSTTPDGCLTFVFRSDPSVQNPGWVANVTCTPAPTCARPVLLTAFPITQTSAILNWTQLANPDGSVPTAWEVLVLPAGSPVPTGPGIPVTSTTYTANSLIPGTAYVFYVRAICSPTDASTWSALNFATLPTNDECANATFAIVNQNLNCVQTTHGTLAGATASSPATTCGGAGAANDDVWFTFTATAATHIISFNNVTPNTALSYAIYQGSCGGLTEVGCNSGANLVAGTTYFIRVFSTGTVPVFTNFDLCIGTLPCTEAPAFCTGQTVTYANATNVPSLGQIGCLFTSPNPAFFFLQVNQQGPLSYLISQVDAGGVGRDVDYVAWGPFTDLNTACSGVPANPMPGLLPALTPAQGCQGTLHACSYSANPTEIMCIPNAQLCEVYVIMITNFSNQPGFVTFTQTNTGGGTTECFPINTFNYPQTYYCQNDPNPTPVLAPGASAGTYTSTPGLVIDPATGTINLAASTPGPYVITSTTQTSTGGVCTNIPSITTTRTVITAPANATISYSAATYCNSITTAQSVTFTGTTGGSYSASPAGLLLNGNTGEIIPVASAPGVYTVSYTVPASGGCPAFTTSTQVEILASPVLTQTSVAACDTFTLPALAVGNYYAQAGGIGTPLDISVPITSNQPVYIYAVGTNGCITERQFNVTINTVATPTFTVTQSSCTSPTGSVTVTSPVSAGNPLPSDLFISEVTDADTGSLTYVEIYNGTGSAKNLSNYKLKIYNNGSSSTSCDLALAGTIANNSVKVVSVGSITNAGGVVPNQVFASCGGVNTNDNIRLTTAADVEIDLWGRTDGVDFTPSNQTGYTYRRIDTSTHPSLTWNAADWTALDPEDYTNVGSYTYVVSTYQYSLDNGTYQSSPTFANVAPGTHQLIVKDITTGCFSAPVDVIIDAVNAIPAVTTISYATPVCELATTNPLPDTSVVGFTTGGTFTSNPATGITINASTGEIDLLNTDPGTYIITYSVAFDPLTCRSAGSSTATIIIDPATPAEVGFSYTSPICPIAQATLSPTLASGFVTGGTFAISPATGLTIDPTTGVLTLGSSVTAGTYSVIYTVSANASTCQALTTSTPVQVVITPVTSANVAFTYTSPVCVIAQATITPTLDPLFTAGGTFTANPSTGITINASTGVISLANNATTPGTYSITYSVAQNLTTCQALTTSAPIQVVISPATTPAVGFHYDTPVCAGETVNPMPILDAGFVSGGVFGPAPIVDTTTGEVHLNQVTPGQQYAVTYNLPVNTSTCQNANNSSATISISAPILVELNGGCQSVYVLNATPVNGSFNPETASFSWQNSEGTVVGTNQSLNPVPAVGNYTVTVTVDGCSNESLPFNVESIACQIQKGISVNNDNFNDTFDLTGFNVKQLTIFNRLGMKVYSRANYVNEWGGKSDNGDELPDGTYFYVIDQNSGGTKTGWIYINRAQ